MKITFRVDLMDVCVSLPFKIVPIGPKSESPIFPVQNRPNILQRNTTSRWRLRSTSCRNCTASCSANSAQILTSTCNSSTRRLVVRCHVTLKQIDDERITAVMFYTTKNLALFCTPWLPGSCGCSRIWRRAFCQHPIHATVHFGFRAP